MAELPKDTIYHYKSKDGLNITVTMTELVRCKDCKWWDNHDGGERCTNVVSLSWAKPENFCNYGERKREVEDGKA